MIIDVSPFDTVHAIKFVYVICNNAIFKCNIAYQLNLYIQGACLAVNAGKWLECIDQICRYHKFSSPKDDEKLPVGTGSNPVSQILVHYVNCFSH